MRTILEILSDGAYHSGEKISAELGISRAAIWKRINQLKEDGWQIESGGKRGYRLLAGDSLDPSLWTGHLTTSALGRGENRYLETVDSTNTQVKLMAVNGAPHGSLCLCEKQTAGRGRLGRSWNSPAGEGLWCSLLLRPKLSPSQAPLLTLCAAMAMNRAVRNTAGIDSRIKWPNDLICDGKKICGILLEISADPDQIEYVVVGTGLNLHPGAYPPELKGTASSLEELGSVPLRRMILTEYLAAFEDLLARLEKLGFAGIIDEYKQYSCTIGSRVHVSGSVDFIGTAENLDDTGALFVRTEDGILHRVLSGDVSVRGVMGYV